MKSMSFRINPEYEVDNVWQMLESQGLQILYASEDENGSKIIYANMEDTQEIKQDPSIALISPFILPSIDWENQFEEHGLNFYEGHVHVDLNNFNFLNTRFNPIKIKPGPGFGDLSHPTTNLVLKQMGDLVKSKHVLDIGTGSGVLSLAAVSLGSLSCFGIDIDEDAINHSRLNAKLNQIEKLVSFGFSKDYTPSNDQNSLLVLMNMIQSEQQQAWSSLKKIHHLPGDCLVSGILKEDASNYLAWTESLNWKLLSTIEEDGWLGFHFYRSI